MKLLTISRTVLFIFLVATIAAGTEKSSPTYQKGTISNISGNHKICELEGTGIHKQINNCGDFQSGQTVDYRIKGTNVYIRRENGKEYKCSIEGTIVNSADNAQITYQQGTIKGWEKGTDMVWVGPHGETYPRDKTVYELKGTDMVYLIDYCGSFQAGKFDLGQIVNYRVDETDKNDMRLYISHDNGEEYKCKIEGQKILKGAITDAPSTAPAVSPPTAAAPTKP
jgi:hypothetical protein